jgi:hypothetical protein
MHITALTCTVLKNGSSYATPSILMSGYGSIGWNGTYTYAYNVGPAAFSYIQYMANAEIIFTTSFDPTNTDTYTVEFTPTYTIEGTGGIYFNTTYSGQTLTNAVASDDPLGTGYIAENYSLAYVARNAVAGVTEVDNLQVDDLMNCVNANMTNTTTTNLNVSSSSLIVGGIQGFCFKGWGNTQLGTGESVNCSLSQTGTGQYQIISTVVSNGVLLVLSDQYTVFLSSQTNTSGIYTWSVTAQSGGSSPVNENVGYMAWVFF